MEADLPHMREPNTTETIPNFLWQGQKYGSVLANSIIIMLRSCHETLRRTYHHLSIQEASRINNSALQVCAHS